MIKRGGPKKKALTTLLEQHVDAFERRERLIARMNGEDAAGIEVTLTVGEITLMLLPMLSESFAWYNRLRHNYPPGRPRKVHQRGSNDAEGRIRSA